MSGGEAGAAAALAGLRARPGGRQAAAIGTVAEAGPQGGAVVVRNALGGRRTVTMPSGEQLPRIC